MRHQPKVLILLFFTTLSHATVHPEQVIATRQQHPETFQFSSPQKQTLALKLAKELRCPQCQNQNLIESNSPVASDLRLKVYEKVEQGQQEQQIIDYMTQRFGDMVHYQPPLNSATLLLWGGPIVIFLVFLWAIMRKVIIIFALKKEQP